MTQENPQEDSIYDLVGGENFFLQLAENFYDRVESDDILLQLYPEPDDLGPAKQRLAFFLIQLWGGPRLYQQLRGNPMLRARHLPFKIAEAERDAWLKHMTATVKELVAEREISQEIQAQLLDYFQRAANHMINYPPPKFNFVE